MSQTQCVYTLVLDFSSVPTDPPFFASGNIESELLARQKQVALDVTEDEKYQHHKLEDGEDRPVFCPIVGCGARLKSLEDFELEVHYNARHTASCSVCSRIFPTSCLLSIHVSEAHYSFFQAKVARGFAMAVQSLLISPWLPIFTPTLPSFLIPVMKAPLKLLGLLAKSLTVG